MDVTGLMRQAAHLNAEHTAIITEEVTLTFAQAWARGVRLANALRDRGIRPGDRVASLEDNNLGCVDAVLGCAIAGAVRVPLYARNSTEAHAHMVSHTDSQVLLVDEAYADSVRGLEDAIDSLEHVVIRDGGYEKWLAGQDDTDPMIPIDPESWYIIRHSGGTTGAPKGVAYTHHDWVLNCRNWAYALERISHSSVIGHAGPISHASGYLFLPGWLAGAANLVFGAFEPNKVLDMMGEHRVSHMFASPSLLAALSYVADGSGREWPHLRAVMVGGAPITDATALRGRKVFGDTLFQGFGQTEAVPLTGMGPEEWFGEVEGSTPMRAAGRVLPFAQVQIWDEDGKPLPIGETGEIVAKVEGQMRGYWGDEELTRTRLVDGWVRTKDIGRLDHNGFLYVLDRVEDMIVSGGFNIWPAELETVIEDHPAVYEAAVFGIPDERWGETPMAVVHVGDPAAVTAEEIIDLCRERLGSYKKPGRVQITTEPLPKSVVGKLLRKRLREPHWAGHDRRVFGA
ncbi:class I adenylate-forming enzyme family protein [Nocardia huaxiensis]|uniref:AMP-binding protein n=1 Tax=Nocardia huaxiensis TaxID=2755382 RepID=A0A7D6ZGL8_9NOCA|nr:AMP-binding protein [Nocardia huaxiensis]QLY29887.1 AMP-binding protein [Nocardia huaxiensis]UFS96524.1 AMP-binding protein [Nocardia huaxiensis]